MKLSVIARVRIFVVFIFLLGLVCFSYIQPKYYNYGATFLNNQMDKLKYIDQLNIPLVQEKGFTLGLDLQGGAHLVYEADVTAIDPAAQKDALDSVRDTIEKRVNFIGVSEPVIQTNKSEDKWRVIVELSGVKDLDQAIAMIGTTPILEFKEENPASNRELTDAEKASIVESDKLAKSNANKVLTMLNKKEKVFEDLAKEYSGDTATKDIGGYLGFQKRGVFVPEFSNVIFDQLKPGEMTKTPIKTEFGYHIIRKISERGEGDNKEVESSHILLKVLTKEDILSKIDYWVSTQLSGKNLKRATVEFDPNTNLPEVALEFDDEGKQLFSDITERNINKRVAIFLDGYPITTPVVQAKIDSGRAVISGKFTTPEARQLAVNLNSGALPVPITLISQQRVGASLGTESLKLSLMSGIAGLILVVLFMIIFYRLPGVLAIIALLFYATFMLTIFKLIPITLTLAGMAGFILSLGMAVDANVLIFERMKEELRRGRPLDSAIEEGFARAWSSIRDGNFTTIIACIVLMWFSTSMVKGFAITLGIGVIMSMLTAFSLSRYFLRLAADSRLSKYFWIWLRQNKE